MNSVNATKRSSIIDMLNEGSSEELNNLKEFLELLKQNFDIKLEESERLHKRKLTSQKLDDEYINLNIGKVLESCLERTSSMSGVSGSAVALANKKSDLALKILESLSSNSAEIENFDKIKSNLITLFDKAFFDKLIKIFQSIGPDYALKMVKVIIELMGKMLHHHLSIINPLLQIMELAFKHVNNDIKAQSYECWSCLIKNFALDRDFFFKPKKFNLILMPLLNKCKTYKDEVVCKSKVLTWLCLIENINNQLPKYINKVLFQFFNYCFGLNAQLIEQACFNEDGNSEDNNQVKFKKFLSTKIEPEHEFQSLFQIGFELLVSIFFNGDLGSLDSDLRKKFIYVKKNQNYDLKKTLNDKNQWLCLMKYYFDIFIINKSNQSNDGVLIIETWKKICNLFDLSYKSSKEDMDEESNKTDFDDEMIQDNQSSEIILKENLNELIEYFLTNSVEFIYNFTLSTKNNENKFPCQFSKLVLRCLNNQPHQYFTEKNEFILSVNKLIKKAANLLLLADDDNTNSYLNNLNCLTELTEKNQNLIDLYQWLHLATKLNDHLKSIKTKTNQINLSERNYELVHLCIMFPFKNYKLLNILETDLKLVVSACTNIGKLFSALIKQNRIKICLTSNSSTSSDLTLIELESQNVNNWCSRIFYNLKLKYKKSNDNSLLYDLNSYWSDLSASLASNSLSVQAPTSYLIDHTIKCLQLQVQFSLFILQNFFEYDSINQLQSHDSSDSNSNLSVIEKLGLLSSKKQDNNTLSLFSNLVELIQKQIRLFYDFIKSQSNQMILNNKSQLNDEEMDDNLKKETVFDFVDSPKKQQQSHQSSNTQVENKQPIQIYCFLIEQLSILFTRIKVHHILNELLVSFAPLIEIIAELNYISRSTPQSQQSNNQSQSQLSSQHFSHLNSHYRYSSANQEKILIQLQSNRRSNELYDTFSMQIASFIQNHLSKTYSYHEFDSSLLEKIEPIFFSFLTYSTKPNLKQKTLQAWNSTFGKSTVSSLKYSKRLENLFVEIREEMIDKSKSSNNSSSGLFAISLPGFKPIDLLNQTTNTTNSTFIQEPSDEFMNDEKENTPENVKNSGNEKNSGNLSDKVESSVNNKDGQTKEYLNESSSSVPMVHFMNTNKNTQLQTKQTNETIVSQLASQSTALTANFVFSPAGRNSFLNSLNNQTVVNKSLSASKASTIKTPENKNLRPRQSPRSLNHNSKRKLDLSGLIDQMPDKDFVEITKSTGSNCDLMQRINKTNKTDSSNKRRSTGSKSVFKQPLTEHQKEVRKTKSFIPMEIQSVCSELEPTMDSQMSCSMMDDDTNTQSQLSFSLTTKSNSLNHQQMSNETAKAIFQFKSINKNDKNETPKTETTTVSILDDENANDKMDFESPHIHVEVCQEQKDSNEEKSSNSSQQNDTNSSNSKLNSSQTDSSSTSSNQSLNNSQTVIKFQSKINPKKQITLFEIKTESCQIPEVNNKEAQSEDNLTPSQNVKKEEKIEIEIISNSDVSLDVISNSQIKSQIQTETKTTNDESSETGKRRSVRLKLKDVNVSISNDSKSDKIDADKDQISNELSKSINSLGEKISSPPTEVEENESLPVTEKKSSRLSYLEKLKIRNNLLKRSKKVALFKKKQQANQINTKNGTNAMVKKNINNPKFKKLIIKSLKQQQQTQNQANNKSKKLKKHSKKLKILEQINKEFNDSLKEDKVEETIETKNDSNNIDKTSEIADVSMNAEIIIKPDQVVEEKVENDSNDNKEKVTKIDEKMDEDDEDDDDEPLSNIIKKRTQSVKNDEKVKTDEPKNDENHESKGCETTENIDLKSLIIEKETESTKKTDHLLEPLLEEESSKVNKVSQLPFVGMLSEPTARRPSSRLSTNKTATTDDLIHKLNNTPTTSILKKRLSKIANLAEKNLTESTTNTKDVLLSSINPNMSAQLIDNNTPSKRRVSFCESVQVEEIEPNFNKSLFNRSTPRIQNKAKIVLSPYFNKTNSPSTPTTSSATTASLLGSGPTTPTSTTSGSQSNDNKASSLSASSTPLTNKTPSSSSATSLSNNNATSNSTQPKSNPNNRLSDSGGLLSQNCNSVNQLSSMNVSNPQSSSLIDFFSNNKQSFLSPRSSIIQQQMQQHQNRNENSYGSPLLNKGLSTSLNLDTNTTVIDSPKVLNKTCTESNSSTPQIDTKSEFILKNISSKLKNSKISLETLFDQIDTSLYMTKLGVYKYFKYKNILTIGDFCSLTANEINIQPFKIPKLENFVNLIQKFEEKCSDLINKHAQTIETTSNNSNSTQGSTTENSNKPANQPTNLNILLGSVEEEMEKLESTNCLDTSIECESLVEALNNQSQVKQDESGKTQNNKKDEDTKTQQKPALIDVEPKKLIDDQQLCMEIDLDSVSLKQVDEKKEVQKDVKTEQTDENITRKITEAIESFNKTLDGIKLDASLDMNMLFHLSKSVDETRLKLTESLNNKQMEIMNLIKSKINQNENN